MIKDALHILIRGEDLSYDTTKEVMNEIMSGEATNAQIASFLTAIRMKGESIDEITACAAVMREKGVKLAHNKQVIDIVGTGGDESFTFNISTVSAFVVAAAGVPVAKHGNRSVSSKCGAADLLEALGAKLDLTAEQSAHVLEQTELCFMFAPVYHTSMKYAAPVRKEMGTRTIFNILGPLANPAGAPLQLLGVYDEALLEPMAKVLANLGVKRAMVVHGDDGIDEISLASTTHICELNNGELKHYVFDPRNYGFSLCTREDLVGGDAQRNAEITRNILSGEMGAKRDIVLLNAASCFVIAGKTASVADGILLAAKMIDTKEAYKKMKEFIQATNEVSK